jgi:hypothetical protein
MRDTTYTLVMAAGMITGGKVGDILGRWVFVAEVFIAFGTMLLSGKIPDVAVDERPVSTWSARSCRQRVLR